MKHDPKVVSNGFAVNSLYNDGLGKKQVKL